MFSFLDTRHKRKSAALTSVIMSLLLVALFFVGLSYLDPPEEYGIAVNFGTSDVGSGTVQPKEAVRPAPVEETVKETVEESTPEKVVPPSEPEVNEQATDKAEEVLTQENEEALAIQKQLEIKKKAEEAAREERERQERIERERLERIERERKEEIARQKAEEDAKRKKLDALIGGVSNSEGTATGGEGNDDVAGDKGQETGDPNASGYYGNGGGGGGGDYNLGNRRPLTRPKPDYICNEEGLVVVSIEVDVNGKVIKATPGVKGSTNTATCLLSQAKEAALKTKWQADSNAPSKQFGTIKYRFSLSK